MGKSDLPQLKSRESHFPQTSPEAHLLGDRDRDNLPDPGIPELLKGRLLPQHLTRTKLVLALLVVMFSW